MAGSKPGVNAFLADVRHTLVPTRASAPGPDGRLPPLLVALTLVTGLVDAFSYLVLGHVFVANMTGNVVFLAFALAGTGGFSALAALVAIAGFAAGALIAGRLGRHLLPRKPSPAREPTPEPSPGPEPSPVREPSLGRGRWSGREGLLGVTVVIQAVLLGAAVIVAALAGSPLAAPLAVGPRYALIVVLSVAMGAQNATARKLAVPDLTTTVLTLTITGVAADSPVAGATGAHAARRLISVAAMLLGALCGALLVLHVHIVFPLVIALLILVAVAVTTFVRTRSAV
jgi:uncharacterized membrane protein YoaK (UPF0700 family)